MSDSSIDFTDSTNEAVIAAVGFVAQHWNVSWITAHRWLKKTYPISKTQEVRRGLTFWIHNNKEDKCAVVVDLYKYQDDLGRNHVTVLSGRATYPFWAEDRDLIFFIVLGDDTIRISQPAALQHEKQS